ncbi:hypothetical protein ACQ4PT_010912 [Festuca glaucescens]
MWQDPFLKEYTVDGKFHRLDGSTFDVPFMRGWGREYIACHDGFKVLKLPYKQGMHDRFSPPPRFSMCVFLPDARDGLAGLIHTIASSSSPDFLREHLPTSLVRIGNFRLPRFKLTFSGDMSAVLQSLGLQVAFDEKEADLHVPGRKAAGSAKHPPQGCHRGERGRYRGGGSHRLYDVWRELPDRCARGFRR